MSFMPIDDNLKGIYEDLQSGEAFDRTLETTVTETKTSIDGLSAELTSIPVSINGVASDITSSVRDLTTTVEAASARIPEFSTHLTEQFDNLANNITTFASSQGLKNALSGGGGCGDMSKFFGSLTHKGNDLVGKLKSGAGDVTNKINQFKTLTADLQTKIAGSKSTLLAKINEEMVGATGTKLSELQALKTQVETQFQTGVASTRAELSRAVEKKLSTSRAAFVAETRKEMQKVDINISAVSKDLKGLADKMEIDADGLTKLVAGEKSHMQTAVKRLETFAAAASSRSLFQTNSCVQQLMGFVGKESFLKKLG